MEQIYPKEIQQIPERFFRQAYECVYDNLYDLNKYDSNGLTLNAFNKNVNYSQFCPTLTTRCEGFKTAIIVLEINNR